MTLSVKERLSDINRSITETCQTVQRHAQDVTIIAVTKYVSVETTKEAISAGIRNIGENRLEGLQLKQDHIDEADIKWHFIGSLQSRKVKEVINHIDYLHSLDRMSLAMEIEKRAEKPVNCFLQVNISGEDTKHGLSPAEVVPMVEELKRFTKVNIVGLMTMAPYIDDEDKLRKYFRDLKQLQVTIQSLDLPHAPCRELSMGMSNDYIIAIEEGATFVRIGTALVGKEL